MCDASIAGQLLTEGDVLPGLRCRHVWRCAACRAVIHADLGGSRAALETVRDVVLAAIRDRGRVIVPGLGLLYPTPPGRLACLPSPVLAHRVFTALAGPRAGVTPEPAGPCDGRAIAGLLATDGWGSAVAEGADTQLAIEEEGARRMAHVDGCDPCLGVARAAFGDHADAIEAFFRDEARLPAGRAAVVPDVGVVGVRIRAPRTATNPATGQRLTLPGGAWVYFVAAVDLA